MPFDSGPLTVTFFSLPEKLPDNYLERFNAHRAGMLDQVQDEPQIGWVSGRHLLETSIDEETAICGGHFYFTMRTAERKIPPALLKAICRREELVYMKANDTLSVPTKVRREIKENAIEKNLMKMPPSLSGVPAVVDMTENILYVGSASQRQIDEFVALFYRTVDIEPEPINVESMMAKFQLGNEHDLPKVCFSDQADLEPAPLRDFLTWLWYRGELDAAPLEHSQFGPFNMLIDAPLTLAFAAEARGAAETMIKKGDRPQQSAEAKAALNVGKKLKKAKFFLSRGEDAWSGTFDADRFTFSGLTLPEGDEMELHSRFAERILNLHIFLTMIEEYFCKFVKTITADNFHEEEEKFIQWAKERESY